MLGWEDPLEKGKATHSSILAWRIPWTVQSMGSERVGHNWATFTFTFSGYRTLNMMWRVCNSEIMPHLEDRKRRAVKWHVVVDSRPGGGWGQWGKTGGRQRSKATEMRCRVPLFKSVHVSSAQSLSHVLLFATPWTAARQASLSITNSRFTKTHVHWVGDAIQPSHPLSSPSPPVPSPSQHQDLFQWVNSSHQVAKVLELQLQDQPFQWIIRFDFL